MPYRVEKKIASRNDILHELSNTKQGTRTQTAPSLYYTANYCFSVRMM